MNTFLDSQASPPIGGAPHAAGHLAAQQRSVMAPRGPAPHGAEPALTAADVRELIRLKRVIDLCRFSGGHDGRA